MYKIATVFIVILFFFSACKNNKANEIKQSATTDSTQLLPVIDMLIVEVNDVIKTPYYLYKISQNENEKNKKDSISLTREEFKKIVEPLIQINLIDKNGSKSFTETIFLDLSTHSISIIHTPILKSNNIKSITTLLNDETKKLKSIYIVTDNTNRDTSITTNYFWKAEKSLTIAKIVTYKNKQILSQKNYINWNDVAYK